MGEASRSEGRGVTNVEEGVHRIDVGDARAHDGRRPAPTLERAGDALRAGDRDARDEREQRMRDNRCHGTSSPPARPAAIHADGELLLGHSGESRTLREARPGQPCIGQLDRPTAFAPLTSVRFFAAFAVVVHHAGGPAFADAPESARSLREFGAVAVRFFFILSGFVLALKYADTARVPRVDAPRFWLARFARIYPVYVVALVLFAAVATRAYPPTAPERDPVAGVLSLFLVPS